MWKTLLVSTSGYHIGNCDRNARFRWQILIGSSAAPRRAGDNRSRLISCETFVYVVSINKRTSDLNGLYIYTLYTSSVYFLAPELCGKISIHPTTLHKVITNRLGNLPQGRLPTPLVLLRPMFPVFSAYRRNIRLSAFSTVIFGMYFFLPARFLIIYLSQSFSVFRFQTFSNVWVGLTVTMYSYFFVLYSFSYCFWKLSFL